jgi:hypothetical protein
MLRCCAIGNFKGALNLGDRTLGGYPATVSSSLKRYLDKVKGDVLEGDWVVYPRFRQKTWQFYVLHRKPKDSTDGTFLIKGVIKWVKKREDGKLDIGVKIYQKHHNNFVVVLISNNDQYYKRQSGFQFKCRFDCGLNELISQGSIKYV